MVVDNQDRENEGDLIIAAEKMTTQKMAFMLRHTRFLSLSNQQRRGLCANEEGATGAAQSPLDGAGELRNF